MERPRTSDRRIYSYSIITLYLQGPRVGEYLSNIRTDLPDLSQELQASHPLRRGKSSLAREIMEVRDEALQDVLHSRVLAERVDADHILGDVFHRQVLHRRDLDLRGIHLDKFESSSMQLNDF